MQPDLVEILKQAISSIDYEDGGRTASGMAKNIKKNFQITERNEVGRHLLEGIRGLIRKNEQIDRYAVIKNIVDIRIASYREGGYYGWHVDRAIMGGVRTDISFTLFLNSPESYEGGELEIQYENGIDSIKGEVGEIVLYPTGRLHQVKPVLSGERLVAVGWINSCVVREEDRLALMKMNNEIERLSRAQGDIQEFNDLRSVYQHFKRILSI